MKLFIPPLGTQIKLTAPWRFTLYDEYRNRCMKHAYNLHDPICENRWRETLSCGHIELNVSAIVQVERIYIRHGQKGFDSVTFRLIHDGIKKCKNLRFWVKLAETNNIEGDVL